MAVDSDFAGCLETRKSSAGGCARWGGAVIKCWSRTLPTIALSSGEAELGALVKGAAEADGLVAILGDFGLQANIVLESDASAAVGITQRLGLGKVRHLATADLWIQQRAKDGSIRITKVKGTENTADLMTKGLDGPRIDALLQRMGVLDLGETARGVEEERADGKCEARRAERNSCIDVLGHSQSADGRPPWGAWRRGGVKKSPPSEGEARGEGVYSNSVGG